MFVPFESLPPTSRVWIYQSDRKFSVEEQAIIESALKLFTNRWAAHGQPLKASFQIVLEQFVIVAADENYQTPSGCSIDDSVRVMQEISKRIGADLFNRNLIAFKKGSVIETVNLQQLKQKYAEGVWEGSTLTFNNLVNTKQQFETEWVIAASATWLKRFVPGEKVTS
jgi:hypothetical protein